MQDRDVVAAVVAGDPDGIAGAYDRYAASLYAYCHSMLPGPEAAEVVQDSFIIAVSKLDGLGDPDRLDAWLHAVARNECLRRLGPKAPKEPKEPKGPGYTAGAGPAVPGSAGPDDVLPAVTLPVELRGRVLTACADNSPTGRAHRMSVAHRAGTFGPAGFPKAIAQAGPRWWQGVRRHPRVLAAVVLTAVVAAAAGITVIMTASGSHRPQAFALGVSGGGPVSSSSASAASSPAHQAAPSASPPAPSTTIPAGVPSPGPLAGRGTPEPSASPSQTSSSASPSPSPSPSPSVSPSRGYLLVAPDKLVLTAVKGKTASGFFVVTATGAPVSYTIKVPAAMAGKVTVAPSKGSLPANGHVTVTVTVTSMVALNTYVTVEPGNLIVQVVLKIKV
jgi:DNA-directed RNA polymerase specialized sigma24 family protein